MAILSSDGTYVTVQEGDNLWNIAATYLGSGTKYTQLATINGISDPSYITIGQIIYLYSNSGSGSAAPGNTSSPSPYIVTITQFGLLSNSTKTLFAAWNWTRENTEGYKVLWTYDTGNGVELQGTNTTITIDEDAPEMARQSTFTIPEAAIRVYFKVKPIAKSMGNNDTKYWTVDWSGKKTYNHIKPLPIPDTPTIEIDEEHTLTATLDNIDIDDADSIVFQVVQDNESVYATSQPITVVTGHASYSCTVTPGHEYKVRCYAYNTISQLNGEWSSYSSNASTCPVAPEGITTIRATSETSIYLEWSEVSTAETYDIEYATELNYFDNTDQTTVKTGIETNHFEFIGLESGLHYYFRVRAVNAQGESGWTEIADVIIGEAPAAPTTWSSTTTAYVGESVVLYWVHNSKDGSSQRFAEIEFTINGVLIQPTTTIRNSEDEDEKDKTSSFVIDTNEYPEGTKIEWRVRTAGIALNTDNGGYGEWSTMRVIDIYAQPSLILNVFDVNKNPVNELTDNKLMVFPFYASAVAYPKTQTPIGYHVAIISEQVYETVDIIGNPRTVNKGENLYSKYFDTFDDLMVEFTPGNLDLANSMRYTLTCTVSMDSGLTAEASVTFEVSWTEMSYAVNAEIGIDKETLTATIRPYCARYYSGYVIVENVDGRYIKTDDVRFEYIWGEIVPGARTIDGDRVYHGTTFDGENVLYSLVTTQVRADRAFISVYRREYDGKFTLLASRMDSARNVAITDPHPALDYARYRIVAAAKDTGAITYADLPGVPVGGKSVIIQWSEQWTKFDIDENTTPEQPAWSGSMLKLPCNIDVNEATNVDVSFVEYVGREHPVSYYGTHIGETASWSVSVPKSDKETIYALRRLAKWMGDVYVREPSGIGYWANISVSFGQKHNDLVVPVSFSIRRVEGGA